MMSCLDVPDTQKDNANASQNQRTFRYQNKVSFEN